MTQRLAGVREAFRPCTASAPIGSSVWRTVEPDGAPRPPQKPARFTLQAARLFANKRYTDSGAVHDDRGLKHRADKNTRPVPIPPALVKILREHIEEFGVAGDGRLFVTSKGGLYTNSVISRVWKSVRKQAFTPEQVVSSLAARKTGCAGRAPGGTSWCLSLRSGFSSRRHFGSPDLIARSRPAKWCMGQPSRDPFLQVKR
ncbi:hypothetical protein Ssi03_77410 [Sphaerisporangium siamense]|uniref:Tyr recombinase domain-containing protein n=1 Tax=Sphaerisporangium siamense TaxID=795645 RepID=A0A7W7G7I0_9ACTN|nr:hypothetical protein [Sphaerisporangium siamense]MBB4700628.1 hypothetical protein [Sphaerisporangium siamense]GII89751.1 hypothetical protein Ssi03_77410 [Sphaerisporangium siamense]